MPELIEKRTRNSKTHHLGGRKYSWDGTIGSIHYKENGEWLEIDNIFEPALAPWNWQMLKAGYHIRVKEDFTAGQIIEFEKQGETVQFQPMALEWTNDLNQIQQISMPQSVSPVITNPEVDLLSVVGMPSHQGTIRWNNAYGEGIDFEWRCTSTRLVKILEVENLNKLPVPEQYILDGGNPVLRLNLIFAPSKGVDIYVDGELWERKGRVQTFKVIEFRKDSEVLWGFMPLRYWGSESQFDPETGEDANEGQSVATLEKRGNKLYISIRVPYEWLQGAVYPVFIDAPVEEQVGDGADDCYRRLGATTAWSLTGDSLYVGALSTSYYKYGSGMRFQTVAIEPDIDVAYLTLTTKHNIDSAGVNTRISAEDVDDALAFADDGGAFDTRWAARTTERVDWDNIEEFVVDGEYDSPSIVSVIQEIVDRGGWASGQDIVIFWEDFEDRTAHDEVERRRVAVTYEKDTGLAAQLYIEYTVVGITEKTSSDTGSGVEAKATGNPLATYARSETGGGVDGHKALAPQSAGEDGSGVDALTALLGILARSDTGLGTDAKLSLAVALIKAEVGSGLEHILDRALVLISESGSGVDTVLALLGKIRHETGVGVENSYLHILEAIKTSSETGAGADASTLVGTFERDETGEGVEAVVARALYAKEYPAGALDMSRVLTAAIAGAETGTGAEASLVAFYQKVTETGSGVDASALEALFSRDDVGVGAEAITLLAAMVSHDTGVAVETVIGFFRKLIDSGQGVENLLLIGYVGRAMKLITYLRAYSDLVVYTKPYSDLRVYTSETKL